jgi:RHS repeat-associated protein
LTLHDEQVIHDPNGGWFYVYAPGLDEPVLAIRRNSLGQLMARLDIVTSGTGQIVAMADSAGRLNSAYAQAIPGSNGGPWGSGLASRSQTFDPRRWATAIGGDTISTFRNRQYDPATGKWLQEDPIGTAGGVNLYDYNGNDPNSFSDPFGLRDVQYGSDSIKADVDALRKQSKTFDRAVRRAENDHSILVIFSYGKSGYGSGGEATVKGVNGRGQQVFDVLLDRQGIRADDVLFRRNYGMRFGANAATTLAHEFYGHVASGFDPLSGTFRCGDPAVGTPAAQSCVVTRENTIRSEMGVTLRPRY